MDHCHQQRIRARRSLTFDAPGLSAEEGLGGRQTQTFRCEGAGVKVVFQAKEIAGELYRVKPAVRRAIPSSCSFVATLKCSNAAALSKCTQPLGGCTPAFRLHAFQMP